MIAPLKPLTPLTPNQRRAIVHQARVLAEQAQAVEDQDTEHLDSVDLRDLNAAAITSIALSLVVIADALGVDPRAHD